MSKFIARFCGRHRKHDSFPRVYRVEVSCFSVADVHLLLSKKYENVQHLVLKKLEDKKKRRKI